MQATLDYTCECSNGTTIGDSVMTDYQQTVPAQMCYYWYDACINATINPSTGEGNAAQQFQCTQARDSQCGNITIDESSTGSPSSSASGSASATGASATGTGASATGSASPAASAGAAIANFALGTPAMAAGLLAVFGLAL